MVDLFIRCNKVPDGATNVSQNSKSIQEQLNTTVHSAFGCHKLVFIITPQTNVKLIMFPLDLEETQKLVCQKYKLDCILCKSRQTQCLIHPIHFSYGVFGQWSIW